MTDPAEPVSHRAMRGAILTGARIAILAAALAMLSIATLFRHDDARIAPRPHRAAVASHALQPGVPSVVPLPAVEPLVVAAVTPETAIQINAKVAFSTAPNPPARPFVFAGSGNDRDRAITCLASATWYEAGDDAVGEQAVAQVVLNRVRHPAFPKSVCGVVFQGVERGSGCQFTFACDGSLVRRTPSAAAWGRARAIATRALAGHVFDKVGTATHYHTDWVVPYWSATLDKIVAVGTHLFFRWPGWWGQPGAFSGRNRGPEPMDVRISYLAPPSARTDTLLAVASLVADGTLATGAAPGDTSMADPAPLQPEGLSPGALRGSQLRLANQASGDYVLQLDPGAPPGSYALAALALCKDKVACTVTGWLKRPLIPKALPVPMAAMHSASFLYRRNTALDREQVLWNCRQLPRDDPAQCLPGTGGGAGVVAGK